MSRGTRVNRGENRPEVYEVKQEILRLDGLSEIKNINQAHLWSEGRDKSDLKD